MAGWKFELGVDASGFKKGSEEAAAAVDDLADALADMECTGTDALDAVDTAAYGTADSLHDVQDATTDAAGEATDLERKYRDALTGVTDDADRTAKDVKRAFGDNSLSGDDLFDANFRAEVAASARETGSEILGQISGGLADGTLDTTTIATSLSEGAVEIGAEIGGGIGGALVAGGLISSAIVGEVTKTKEAIQDAVSELFDTVLEQGAQAAESALLISNIRELTESQDKLNFSKGLARDLEVDLTTVIRARAGDQEAMNQINEVAAQKEADLQRAYESGAISADELTVKQGELQTITGDVTTDFDRQRQGLDAATLATDAYRESTNQLAEQQIAAAQATAVQTGRTQTLETTLDGVSQTIKVMPNGKVIKVTDDGTAKGTQVKINDITGKDVGVKVYLDDATAWARLNELTKQRSVSIAVDLKRNGQYAI